MPINEEFNTALSEAAKLVEDFLATSMPAPDNTISEGMRYAILNGGKRLRAFLVLESAKLHGVAQSQALLAAAAIECMHAYSLVHDDLPCMDDDDLRRGKPTVHIKWDEASAVLVGDALQCQAFEYLTLLDAKDASAIVRMVSSLTKASGVHGMVGGQAMDIAAESAKNPLNLSAITALQAKKTGALIGWAATAGPMLVDADITPLKKYAEAMGLAFQIRDDILDIEGDAKAAGKRLRKDTEAGKATFVSVLGIDGAKARATEMVNSACEALAPYGDSAQNLQQAAHYAVNRTK